MSFYSVAEVVENEIVINKSRFLTTLIPIKDYDDAVEKTAFVAKKYSDATHNCVAFISDEKGNEFKFKDDGEPQGTAGLPMLEVLKKRRVFKSLAVTTRYFGGIKLGEGGLINAYTRSVSEALDKAKLQFNTDAIKFNCSVDYTFFAKTEELIRQRGEIVAQEFEEGAKICAIVEEGIFEGLKDALVDFCLGKCKIEILQKGSMTFSENYAKKIENP